MTRRSVMNHKFSEVPNVEMQRSSFDRSHGLKTTFDSGNLIPILIDEALPGDTFNLNMTGFARLATPLKPILDNMFMETFFFFIPNRLLWENWERFNGQQDSPGDSTDFVIPTFNSTPGVVAQDIHDYMGVPPGIPDIEFSALFARSYNLVWDSWFRDENLQDAPFLDIDDNGGNPNETNYPMRKRGKRHDYFTSCLPWPQKGDPVSLPLGTTAPIVSLGDGIPSFDIGGQTDISFGSETDDSVTWGGSTSQDTDATWNTPALEADLSSATAATINQLRQAFQVQRLLERDARGGTRYTEVIRAHFGVTSPDQRLQRPEYLGGGSTQIGFTPVANTAEATGTSPKQGNLAAFATASLHNHGFTKSFTEHGVILGLVNVRADLTYQQGLARHFQRQTRYDFYWPALSHIGEQVVKNSEIFLQGSGAPGVDDLAFGYQERYAEYRYKPSMVTGKMRSDNAQSLDIWHLSQDFGNLPVLDSDFIEETPPVDRILAVTDEPEFIFDAYFSMRCARPMPVYGTPGMIDHF